MKKEKKKMLPPEKVTPLHLFLLDVFCKQVIDPQYELKNTEKYLEHDPNKH